MKKILFKIWPFFLILLFSSLFFWKVVLLGQVPIPGDFLVGTYYPWLDYKWGYPAGVPVKNPITSDVVSFTYPLQMLAIDTWKSGQVPLWNKYIFGGTPLLADFQSAPFSPTNFLYLLFNKMSAWSIQIMLQPILAAFFMYCLLRRWKLSKLGSVFGCIVFAFSGFNVIWLEWNGHTLAASFVPLILLFTDYWLTEKKYWAGLLISIFTAMLFCSGYPQIALYLLVVLFIYWLFWVVKQKKWLFKTLFFGVFLILGIGLAAPQVLPGFELLKFTQRVGKTVSYDWTFLPWSKVITFVAPDYFGNHSTGNYWGPQNYTTNTGFVGVTAFCISLLGLWFFKKRTEIKFAAGILIISLLLSFPTPLSIALWKSGFLGMNAAFASRATVLFDLAVSILGAFGIDYLLKIKTPNFLRLLFPGVILVGYLLYTLTLFFLSRRYPNLYPAIINDIDAYRIGLRNLILPFGIYFGLICGALFTVRRYEIRKKFFLFLVFTFSFFELLNFGWKFTPFSPPVLVFPNTPVLNFLAKQPGPFRITGAYIATVNTRVSYNIESFEGYEAEYPLSIAKLIASINSNRSGVKPSDEHAIIDNSTSPILDLLNVKYYLALKTDTQGRPDPKGSIPSEYISNRFDLAFEDKTVVVFRSKTVLPRAFMVYDWVQEKSEDEALSILFAKNFPFREKIVVEDYSQKPGATGSSEVDYLNKGAGQTLGINVKTSEDGLLFISNTYFPGWKAFVDGVETPIYIADGTFMAIPVTKGNHSVSVNYQPGSFEVGVKIAAFSFVALIIVAAVNALGRKRI